MQGLALLLCDGGGDGDGDGDGDRDGDGDGDKFVHFFRQLQLTMKVMTLSGRLQEKRFEQVKQKLDVEN